MPENIILYTYIFIYKWTSN